MLNRVSLVGRLTKDPEVRQAGSTNCCNFTLAVGRNYKKENQPDSDFINCVSWGKTAEFIGNYLKKGNLMSVDGRIQTRSYDGQNGKVFVTEVACESVDNLTQKDLNKSKESKKINEEYDNLSNDYVNIKSDDLPFY